MTLRATRQQVDVLAAGAGAARVTRQYVEVLTEYLGTSYVDTLTLTETVGLNQVRKCPVSESVALAESVEVHGPIYIEIRHSLAFEESVDARRAVTHVSVEDTLEFTERFGRVIPITVSESLSFTEEGVRRKTGIVHDTLTFSETIRMGKGGSVHDTLVFDETAAAGGVYRRTVAENLGLKQACTCWIAGRRFDRQYAPFIGEGPSGAPTPPDAALAAPPVGVDARFQLVYPATGAVAATCTLRAPNLGNKDRLHFNRINRETRGGTLVVYADPAWPKTQVLVLSFSCLHRTEALALLTFLTTYLGQEIGLIDWESRYWRGLVTTTTDPVVEDAADQFTANFEFEGELDPTWTPTPIVY
jgi:hypothetical protein